jgi:hypothetical protein
MTQLLPVSGWRLLVVWIRPTTVYRAMQTQRDGNTPRATTGSDHRFQTPGHAGVDPRKALAAAQVERL